MPTRHKDYYGILQVDAAAEPKEIRAAYKRLSRQYHPDKNKAPDATVRMQDINEAYEVLKDPTKRARYDWIRTSWSRNYPQDEGADWRETAEAEPRPGEWENAKSEEAGGTRGGTAYERQQRERAEEKRRNAVNQRNLGWIAFFVVFLMNLIGRGLPTNSTNAPPVPTRLPQRTLKFVASRMTYHVSYLDQGRVEEGAYQGTRKQGLTLSIENANSGTYCLQADMYYDAGDGIEKSTFLHLPGVNGTRVFGNDWKINGVHAWDSDLLVNCGIGLDGIRLDPHTAVQMTISTYQLPKFPVDSPNHLRIKRIIITALNPWTPEERQDYSYPPLDLPLAEGN